jgi:hypothetical protein
MNQSLKQRFLKLFGALVLLFVLLFLFRLAYGYTKTRDESEVSFRGSFSTGDTDMKRNYASDKYESKEGNTQTSVDQKFEKIADVSAHTPKFEADELKARKAVEQFKGLIQYEQKNGNNGNREMYLHIGVPPESFDALYQNLIQIGRVHAKQITKTDKTNEYKALNAQRLSLEQTRASLIELKAKGGKIDEYMNLENRILEIEQQLQDLGVSLGDFDDVNEFCTVKFSLFEGSVQKISLMHRIKVALEWTVGVYAGLMVGLFFMSLFAYLLLLSLDKFKVLEKVFKGKE